ncbi:MAG: hypothetical protein JXP34_13220, partial [Planctomycetes bacterium]|nr:hypothetical protein [Planctomycetota bacterium]
DEYPEILSAASVTDGALLAVRGGRTRLAGLGSLHASLTRVGCPIAGILWVAGSAAPTQVESVEEVAA